MVVPFLYWNTMKTLELIFSICTYTALSGWILLIFLPKWKPTRTLILSGLASLVIAGTYMVIVLFTIGDDGKGGFGSLEEVAALFENPKALLSGWIHYLAFDLFIGGWEVLNARKNGIPHIWTIPSLVLTLLYGPIGLLSYFVLRAVYRKKILIEDI